MYLLLLSLFDCAVPLGFEFSLTALQGTLLFFLAIFALIYLNSLRQIHLSNPIELLKGGQTGEREPKTKALLAIFGTACLGGGYYIALTTTNPLSAFVLFFVAVVLVIIGTYCLFTAGSIAVLKLLRKNKRYYYQTRHFISLSGMLYRMKQNAVGLANICVLSTAVLVMISSTLSLFLGMEDGLRTLYPRSIQTFSADYADPQKDRLHTITEEVLSARGLSPENTLEYTYLTFAAVRQEDTFSLDNSNSLSLLGSIYSLNFVLLDDYNRLTRLGSVAGKRRTAVVLTSGGAARSPDLRAERVPRQRSGGRIPKRQLPQCLCQRWPSAGGPGPAGTGRPVPDAAGGVRRKCLGYSAVLRF